MIATQQANVLTYSSAAR